MTTVYYNEQYFTFENTPTLSRVRSQFGVCCGFVEGNGRTITNENEKLIEGKYRLIIMRNESKPSFFSTLLS